MAGQRERELPLLAGITALQHFGEELANIVSVPALTVGTGIALVDLLTGGDLLHQVPWLLYVWGVAQAIGIDAQLPGSAGKARKALLDHRYWAFAAYILLAAIIGYIVFVAALVFALRETYHISTEQALNQLGFDQFAWLIQRTAISVGIVAVAAFTRYHPPVMQVEETEAQRQARQARELADVAHKAALRKAQVGSLVGAAKAGVQALTDRQEEPSPDANEDNSSPLNDTPPTPITPRQKGQRAPNSTPRNLITGPQLRQYLQEEMGVAISEDDALAFVKNQPSRQRLEGVRGLPWAANKAATLQRARALYGAANGATEQAL